MDDVLVADASRRTTTLNAYVSGFGSSRRVVVYDNLVDDVDDREILSVVAHELGHARHDDVLTGSLLGAAGAMLGVGLLGLLVGGRAWRGRPAAGASGAGAGGDRHAARQPGGERHQPADRDPGRRGVAARHPDPEAFVEVQKQLALTSLADPTPYAWSQFWFGSHPTTLQRIALAERFARERLAPKCTSPPGALAPRGEGVAGSAAGADGRGPRRSSCSCLGTCRSSRRRRRRRSATIRAAMPAISRPYSTAEAPRSSRRNPPRRLEPWPRRILRGQVS